MSAGAGGAAIVVAGLAYLALSRRGRRVVAADLRERDLRAGLAGRPLTVVSPDGTALHAEIHGSDHGPTFILVHGWMGTSAIWRFQIQGLADHVRVVTYDQRGHGRSQAGAGGDYSSDALAGDLDAVLDQAVPDGLPVVVAGHSMGAMAIVAWAHAHRERVAERLAGAVLVNVGVENLIARSTILPFPSALSALRTAIGEQILAAPLTLPSRTNRVLTRLVRAVALGPAASPAQVALCTEMLLGTPTAVRAAFGATLSTFNLTHGLEALSIPTVVIAGEHDRLTPPVHARAVVDALPEATLVELSGIGHMAPVEAHDEVTRAIRGLMSLDHGAIGPPDPQRSSA